MEEKHETKALALKEERVYIGEVEESKEEIKEDSNTYNTYNTYVYNEYKGRKVNKLTALLLCIFLGYFGIHRFYEGKVATGILYLFTGGLFALGWIYDIVRIAMKPDPYYVDR